MNNFDQILKDAFGNITHSFQPLFNNPPARYIRHNPFSTMALCNIVGDLGFLGFAIEPNGTISPWKLAGAAFTIPAHIVLLAYGDEDAEKVGAEHNLVSAALLQMRKAAKILTTPFSKLGLLNNPYTVSFGMLSLNGAGLFIDAIQKDLNHIGFVTISQTASGLTISLGCALFAAAGLAKNQGTIDRLTKAAPTVLTGATMSNLAMAASTLNGWMIGAVTAFAISNLAGFFTKIDKNNSPKRPQDITELETTDAPTLK